MNDLQTVNPTLRPTLAPDQLVDLVMQMPGAHALVEEQRRQELRAELVAKSEEVKEELTLRPNRAAAVAQLQEEAEEAHRAWVVVRDRYEKAATELALWTLTLENERVKLEGQLRFSADPAIAAFIQTLWTQAEKVRNSFGVRTVLGERHPLSMARRAPVIVQTNTEQIENELQVLATIRQRAEALQLQCLTHDEVLEALAALQAEIPLEPNEPLLLPAEEWHLVRGHEDFAKMAARVHERQQWRRPR